MPYGTCIGYIMCKYIMYKIYRSHDLKYSLDIKFQQSTCIRYIMWRWTIYKIYHVQMEHESDISCVGKTCMNGTVLIGP